MARTLCVYAFDHVHVYYLCRLQDHWDLRVRPGPQVRKDQPVPKGNVDLRATEVCRVRQVLLASQETTANEGCQAQPVSHVN